MSGNISCSSSIVPWPAKQGQITTRSLKNMELDEYPCGYCDHKFKDENRMIKHIKDKHDDDNDEDLSDLEEDEIIEDPNPNFDVVYKANPELNSSSSLIESFACHPCGLNFESEEALSDHITDKHDIDDNDTKKMFSCSSCDKTFRVKSRLKNHAEIHLETSQRQRPYPCQSCDKTFFRSADLWAHEKIHLPIMWQKIGQFWIVT
jgi:DNA-directed RNA polymerase subunit RPC12/RpoP